MSQYAHDGQQRLLKLITLLAGHEITGLAPSDIARQQQCSASVVTRDMANLQLAGFAEQVPETGRWRLSPQLIQIALKHMQALDRAEQRLSDVRNRFSRG
jgi:DNA-binding IclR family transcriptional regulator